jgi:hypothetical protein
VNVNERYERLRRAIEQRCRVDIAEWAVLVALVRRELERGDAAARLAAEVKRLHVDLDMVTQASPDSCAGFLARALREETKAIDAEAALIRERAAHARTQEWLDKFQGEVAARDVEILRLRAEAGAGA